jgi:hypothetical protein
MIPPVVGDTVFILLEDAVRTVVKAEVFKTWRATDGTEGFSACRGAHEIYVRPNADLGKFWFREDPFGGSAQ